VIDLENSKVTIDLRGENASNLKDIEVKPAFHAATTSKAEFKATPLT